MNMNDIICKTNNHLSENDYTKDEEEKRYDMDLEDIYNDPRWFLDNLDYVTTYRVSWKCYGTEKTTPTMPYKYTKEEEDL